MLTFNRIFLIEIKTTDFLNKLIVCAHDVRLNIKELVHFGFKKDMTGPSLYKPFPTLTPEQNTFNFRHQPLNARKCMVASGLQTLGQSRCE